VNRPSLDRIDWFKLLASVFTGAGIGFLLLFVLLRTMLEPHLVGESVLRINRNTLLVEEVLKRVPVDALPDGVIVRRQLPWPENHAQALSDFDQQVVRELRLRHGMVRELRRDRRPLEDPWGGYWIRLKVAPPAPPVWLYQPERLSSLSVWYLPILRSTALLLGMVSGLMVFLRTNVELPFLRVMNAIPDTDIAPLSLLPERGIAPLRLITLRINRLLERLNGVARDRRLLLRGLAHDFGGPQARLMLQAEALQALATDEPRRIVDSMVEELRQLAAITHQLGLLADASLDEQQYDHIALDDFARRLVASYPNSDSIILDIPRLFIWIDLVGFERSLCNLIDNALEYGRPPIGISAQRDGARLRILVVDHGDGLRTPTMPTMGTTQRADDRQRVRHRGLGLQLVDRFCRSQGGRLLLGPSALGGLRAEMLLLPTPVNPLFIEP
jgi:signal transduction histidine kinase